MQQVHEPLTLVVAGLMQPSGLMQPNGAYCADLLQSAISAVAAVVQCDALTHHGEIGWCQICFGLIQPTGLIQPNAAYWTEVWAEARACRRRAAVSTGVASASVSHRHCRKSSLTPFRSSDQVYTACPLRFALGPLRRVVL